MPEARVTCPVRVMHAARMRRIRIEASLSQRDGLGPGVTVVAALPEPKLLSIAVTITVCDALPAGRWKIGFVPVLASTWWSPSTSHS